MPPQGMSIIVQIVFLIASDVNISKNEFRWITLVTFDLSDSLSILTKSCFFNRFFHIARVLLQILMSCFAVNCNLSNLNEAAAAGSVHEHFDENYGNERHRVRQFLCRWYVYIRRPTPSHHPTPSTTESNIRQVWVSI